MIVDRHPEIFTEDIVYLAQSDGSVAEDRWIENGLKDIAPLIPAIRTLNDRLKTDAARYANSFEDTFPDYQPGAPIYFTISMKSFDGSRHKIRGKQALLFGIDVIAKNYGPNANLGDLFDHELFHLYHGQVWPVLFSDGGEVWQAIWGEGLATYVSWRMNPNTTFDDVLLSKTLADSADPKLAALAADLLTKFHSEDDKVAAPYFSGGNPPSNIPDRAGYYVGFILASRIGAKHTLVELAHMSGPELEQQIRQELQKLANGCSVHSTISPTNTSASTPTTPARRSLA